MGPRRLIFKYDIIYINLMYSPPEFFEIWYLSFSYLSRNLSISFYLEEKMIWSVNHNTLVRHLTKQHRLVEKQYFK